MNWSYQIETVHGITRVQLYKNGEVTPFWQYVHTFEFTRTREDWLKVLTDNHNPQERAAVYAVARDELIDRGLIREDRPMNAETCEVNGT